MSAGTNYNITATAGAGGSISPTGNVTVASGDSQTFTVTPDTDYEVDSVTVDGSPASLTANTYTFVEVSDNHTINISFRSVFAAKIAMELQSDDSVTLQQTAGDVTGMELLVPAATSSFARPREFIYDQLVPSTLWAIQHGLGNRYPNVILTDEFGNVVIPLPVWGTATNNYLELSFTTPAKGRAILRV